MKWGRVRGWWPATKSEGGCNHPEW